MLKLLSLELGVVGAVVLALTIADIPAIAVGITAATGCIGAIGYWVVKIITAIKEKQDAIAAKQDEKQDILAGHLTEVLSEQKIIAVKVDGTASAAVAKIDLLHQQASDSANQIALLHQQVEMLLAQLAVALAKDTAAAQQPKA